jgi:hypothetical protein
MSQVFSWIDRRGTRRTEELDEAEDEYVTDRQTCAQLLTLYFARERMADSMPSLATRSLDDMYHQNTSFDPSGDKANRFRELLNQCERIIVADSNPRTQAVRKNRLFSLFTFLHDLSRNPTVKVNEPLIEQIGHEFWSGPSEEEPRGGRVIAASTLTEHYDWFVRKKMANLMVPGLDPKRLFDDAQKDQIWAQAIGAQGNVKCASCGLIMNREEAEFNHKVPWIRGGKTDPANGEPVHTFCHLRGRLAAQVVRT